VGTPEGRDALQLTEQDPGPRGSPQVPQGPGALRGVNEAPFAFTANTDNCLSSVWLAHDGQAGTVESRTSNSKR